MHKPVRSLALLLAVALLAFGLLTAGAQQTTITFWYALGGTQGQLVAQLVERFNQTNPYGIRVQATYSGSYGETAQKIVGSLQAGGLPNGGLIAAAPLWTCREGNYLIEQFARGPEGLDIDDFWPVLLDYNRFGDRLCSLPFNNSTLIMYYNKDLMAAAGLDPNSPPATWAELESMARRIVTSQRGTFGVDTANPDWWFKALVLQNGGQIMAADVSAPAFNSAAGYSAMEFWHRLVTNGLMPPAQHGAARDLFIAGRLAFFFGSTGSLEVVGRGARFTWSTAHLPMNQARGLTPGGAALAMFPSTPERELATWRLLRFLTSPEVSIEWTIGTGYVPIRKSIMNAPAIQELFTNRPEFRAGFEQLEHASMYPHFWHMGVLDNILRNALERVELGAATPRRAIDEAAAELVSEMRN
jgi:sn-glycerol 3-phosphate transport system substrate-binding protein